MKRLPALPGVLAAALDVWRTRLNGLLERVLDHGIRLGDSDADPSIEAVSFDPTTPPGLQRALNSLAFRRGVANQLYTKTGVQPTDWTAVSL